MELFEISEGREMPRRRQTALLAAWVILSPCLGYAVVADAPLIPLLAAAPLALSVARRRHVALTTRYLAYMLTVAVLVPVILNEAYPVDKDRFFFPLGTEVVFPFLITVAIALSYLPQRPLTLGFLSAAALLAFTLAGGTLNDPINSRLPLPAGICSDRYWTFATFLALQLAGLLPLLHAATGRDLRRRQCSRRRRGIFVAATAALVLFTAVSSFLLQRYFSVFENLMARIIDPAQSRGQLVVDAEVDLRRTINAKTNSQRRRIVLRVVGGATPPGYLRARAYTDYANGRWAGARADQPLARTSDPELATAVFSCRRHDDPSDGAVLYIHPAARTYTDTLIGPGAADSFELVANDLRTSVDGTLVPDRWDRRAGLIARSNTPFAQTATWPTPDLTAGDPAAAARYLSVSDDLRRRLTPVAEEYFRDAPAAAYRRVRYLASTLQNRCAYTLQAPAGDGEDPVVHFLCGSHRGHCELFATAAALLLRLDGIPTRYVTGYVCTEPHPTPNAWIARVQDCHAWVEAYVAEAGGWMLIEATPAAGVPPGTPTGRWFERLTEPVFLAWRRLFADVKRGYFARAVLRLLGGLWAALVWLCWRGSARVIFWPLLAAGAFLLWRRARAGDGKGGPGTARRELHAVFDLLMTAVARYRVQRTTSMTVGEVVAALHRESGAATVAPLVRLLRAYEGLRYVPDPAGSAAIRRLRKAVEQYIRGGGEPPRFEARRTDS